MERRTIYKLVGSAVVVLAAALFLCGAFSDGVLTYSTKDALRQKLDPAVQDGSYTAASANQFSTIQVDITIASQAITDCVITSSGSGDLLTDSIREEWAQAIVDTQSATPDTIAGATLVYSAASVQQDVENILAQAKGEAEPLVVTDTVSSATGTSADATSSSTTDSTSSATGTTDATSSATETASASSASAGLNADAKDGSYTAKSKNDFSTIQVDMVIANASITDCTISSTGDMDFLTDTIRQQWAAAIVEGQSATPDTITSATLTYSAGSVKEAVENIFAQANGEIEAESAADTTSAATGTTAAATDTTSAATGTTEEAATDTTSAATSTTEETPAEAATDTTSSATTTTDNAQ